MNRVQQSSGALDRLAAIASLVFVVDFATKQWALHHVGTGDGSLTAGWHLAIVNNTHLGWGLGSSQLALPLTLVLTIAIITLVLRVFRQLSAIDPSAPAMLGLLVGSGAANLADALIPPHGVVDFIAFTTREGTTTSFNIADLVLVIGLGLSVRSMWRIVLAIRGRVPAVAPKTPSSTRAIVIMRDRLLVSSGHALLAMCGFIWLYSMVLPWMPHAGRSAPNSLLCGIGVFALAFMASRARMRVNDRRVPALDGALAARRATERVVLDGSIPAFARDGARQPPRQDQPPRAPFREQPHADEPPAA